MAFHAIERSLVTKYKDQPFVVLGVSADIDREHMQLVEKKQKVTWRSWWDGPFGPIQRNWGIQGFPTIFLIDHRGMIRQEYLGAPRESESLEREIEQLLKEIPK